MPDRLDMLSAVPMDTLSLSVDFIGRRGRFATMSLAAGREKQEAQLGGRKLVGPHYRFEIGLDKASHRHTWQFL
jgi:hypothetical protein